MKYDEKWLVDQLRAIFGKGGQSALARFLIATGDARDHETILRTINNIATGRSKVGNELRSLLIVLRSPSAIPDLIREARLEPEPPMFKLKPAPDRIGEEVRKARK